MYWTANTTIEINLKDYIDNYRDADKFIVYCKECDRYNACWSCPPFNFDPEEYISGYEKAYIIGTKIILNKQVIEENQGWDKCMEVMYRIIEEVRLGLDRRLLETEKAHCSSRAFFAGTCHICPATECAKIKGKPCMYPDKIRPSLESLGFDINKTSSELLNIEMKWSHDGILPEYFLLVSALFANNSNKMGSNILDELNKK